MKNRKIKKSIRYRMVMDKPGCLPILFKGAMTRAILDDIKTETRRTVKASNCFLDGFGCRKFPDFDPSKYKIHGDDKLEAWDLKYGYSITPRTKQGDKFWIKESWRVFKEFDKIKPSDLNKFLPIQYGDMSYNYISENNSFEFDSLFGKWRSPLFMPMWASRLIIVVKDIKFQWLQDISEEDAMAEGVRQVTKDGNITKYCIFDHQDYSSTPWQDMYTSSVSTFKELWDSINDKKSYPNKFTSWDDNPPVLVYKFEKIHGNR